MIDPNKKKTLRQNCKKLLPTAPAERNLYGKPVGVPAVADDVRARDQGDVALARRGVDGARVDAAGGRLVRHLLEGAAPFGPDGAVGLAHLKVGVRLATCASDAVHGGKPLKWSILGTEMRTSKTVLVAHLEDSRP
jgi:hypothetical protein